MACELQKLSEYKSIFRFFDNSLITQPVTKIHTLDHGGGPFVTGDESQRLEDIFDITMAPVLAFDGGDRGDISSSKGMYLREYQEQY